MSQILEVPMNHWQVSDVRRWCRDRDYRSLFSADACQAAVPVAERFDWTGKVIEPGFRRIRVLGRQLFVLSRAALGGNASAQACVPLVANVVLGKCIGPHGQFVSRLDPGGRTIDPACDLYDIAFGLFGLAWWYRYSGDERVLPAALRSVAHLNDFMRSPSGMGFVARTDIPVQHSQNPHMHLFEAALHLCAYLPHADFAALAAELFALAEQVLFDPSSGTIAEEFDGDWRPIAKQNGQIWIEPGHQFEWAWLLDHFARIGAKPEPLHLADRLFAFAESHGIDQKTGLVFDAVSSDGQVLAADLRIWPNTERLKAQVVMAERAGRNRESELALHDTLARIRHFYLRGRPLPQGGQLGEGWWIDYLHADGKTLKSDHVPASTLYHIVSAFSEVIRYCDNQEPFTCHTWHDAEDFVPFMASAGSRPDRVANA